MLKAVNALAIVLLLTSLALALTPGSASEGGVSKWVTRWVLNAGSNVWSVSWSPDGEKIAIAAGDIIVLGASGDILWRGGLERDTDLVAWSPDSAKVALVSGDTLYVFGSEGSELWEWRVSDSFDYIKSAEWSPDSSKVAVITSGSEVVVLDSSNGDTVMRTDCGCGLASLSWAQDSRRLAVGYYSPESAGVIAYGVTGGNVLWERTISVPGSPPVLWDIEWGPRDVGVAVATGWGKGEDARGKATVLKTGDGEVMWESPILVRDCHAVAWSPNGLRLATASFSEVAVLGEGGALLWRLNVSGVVTAPPAWSPNSSTLALPVDAEEGFVVKVFSADGELVGISDPLSAWVEDLAWSPGGDGVLVAYGEHVALLSPSGGEGAIGIVVAGDLVVGEGIRFEAINIPDEWGVTEYSWDFGDGTDAVTASPTATHSYSSPGTYTVRVTVTYGDGSSLRAERTVTVTERASTPGTMHSSPANGGGTEETPSPGRGVQGAVVPVILGAAVGAVAASALLLVLRRFRGV